MQTPISSATANLLPTMDVRQLIATMREFRDRLLSLVADLDDRQLIGPRLAIVNPPLWEIGHVAWTQEFWVLRHLYGEKPIGEHGDRLYNSTDVAHDTRWELLLPNRDDTLRYMNEVLERCCERIAGKFQLGPEEFYFEKWAHEVMLKPFRIARAPVANGEFLEFVEDGGYRKAQYWSDKGWQWLESGGSPALEKSFAKFFNKDFDKTFAPSDSGARSDHPVYWLREENGGWLQRVYDSFVPLNENLPVIHVTWYEAEAYCSWAGRRLPSETEWEVAASAESSGGLGSPERRYFPWGDVAPTSAHANLDWHKSGVVEVGAYAAGDSPFGCRQMIGNVWEWTADDFQPYPGNFYTPDRRDVWAGFRTCAK